MKSFWLCCAFLALFLPATLSFAQEQDPAAAAAGVKPAGQPVPNPLDPQPDAAPPVATPDWMKYENHYVGEQNDLSNPHRTPEEVLAWAGATATDALSYTAPEMLDILKADGATEIPEDVNTKLNRVKAKFSPQGWTEFAAFMKDNLIDRIRLQNQSVGTIVNGLGAVTDKGPDIKSYFWKVRLPLLISATRYDAMKDEQKTVSTTEWTLTVIVLRTPQENIEADGMAIERWVMTPRASAAEEDSTPSPPQAPAE